jgi:putative iron-dependent peroxidase
MQSALIHSPGLFSAVSLWRAQSAQSSAGINDALAQLLDEAQHRRGLHLLVGRRLPQDGPWVVPWKGPAGYFPSTQTEVIVQVAADSRETMLRAVRRTHIVFTSTLSCDEEILGGKIGDGREPFGFKDGVHAPTSKEVRHVAEIKEGALAGGSWLLYLRFQSDLGKFARLNTHQQERVFGITREDKPIHDAPPDAHVPLTRAYSEHEHHMMIRRGFPFRQNEEEGLAFIAASSDLEHYRRALDVMLGSTGPSDAVLRYAEPVGGGVYYAPPDAHWLRHHRNEFR